MKTMRAKHVKGHFAYFEQHNRQFAKHLTNFKVLFWSEIFVAAAVVSLRFLPNLHANLVSSLFAFSFRLPNWNVVSTDKQWILRRKEQMDDQKIKFVDLLHRRRLQTLLSVDDSVAKIFHTLQSLGIENETYIFFTSDHGYHLGQFALVKGKSMPFEADIRVPFYVRGPSIPKNIRYSAISNFN